MVSEPARGAQVLIVEDDPAILFGLQQKLEIEGFDVRTSEDGEAAREALADQVPDLLILDLMLPKLDGISVLRWVRERFDNLPVLILSAKSQEADKVEGLRVGADDYLVKPFGLDELMARIDALLRRTRGRAPIVLDDVTIDIARTLVTRNGEEIPLSKREADLLFFLAQRRGRITSRDEILDTVWGLSSESGARQVDYHVVGLRKKIEIDPRNPRWIVTHHGRGYELRV
ncbi:MAG: response regulator transcription factor [Planctomycetota bacterium]